MRAKVYVTLKPGVLDPAGKAIERSLHALGFAEAHDVRLGKYIELRDRRRPPSAPTGRIDEMCRKLLGERRHRGLPLRDRRVRRGAAMRWGVVTFPGSLDDDDAAYALEQVLGEAVVRAVAQGPRRCTASTASSCRAASPTATTCAAARWRASRRSWRASSRFAARRRPRDRHLQRLPDPLRGRPAARRADPQPRPAASSARASHVRVEETDTPFTSALHARRGAAPADQARRRLLRRRRRDARSELEDNRQIVLRYVDASGRATDGGEPERLAAQHRRHRQRARATSSA